MDKGDFALSAEFISPDVKKQLEKKLVGYFSAMHSKDSSALQELTTPRFFVQNQELLKHLQEDQKEFVVDLYHSREDRELPKAVLSFLTSWRQLYGLSETPEQNGMASGFYEFDLYYQPSFNLQRRRHFLKKDFSNWKRLLTAVSCCEALFETNFSAFTKQIRKSQGQNAQSSVFKAGFICLNGSRRKIEGMDWRLFDINDWVGSPSDSLFLAEPQK